MAEAVLSIVAEGVLGKLFSLAAEELCSVWGFKKGLKNLAQKLEMIQALMIDAESKQTGSMTVQFWIKKLMAVSFEADNLLDEFAYEISKQKQGSSPLLSLNPTLFRLKLAQKVKSIDDNLERIYKESIDIGLRVSEGAFLGRESTAQLLRKTDPCVVESDVVDRANDVAKIVEILVGSDDGGRDDVEVVSVVGMPGLGKTTVAQLVYKDHSVVRCFDHRMWVCVSEDFNVDRLLVEMVQSLTLAEFAVSNREAIVKKLQQSLNGKKYLLVLDDIWNEDRARWENLRKCLVEIGGCRGSRIMITTRSEEAVAATHSKFAHRLEALRDEEGWALFRQIAFARGGADETPELKAIGRRVAQRCGNMPLAIKTLGGIMYSRNSESEWASIENSMTRASSSSSSSSKSMDAVLSTLRLSYDHLPSLSVRQCFAYCAIFQKDCVMEKDKLVQLWMAQGWLKCSMEDHLLEMEEMGNMVFNVMLRSSLFQDAESDECGNIKTCKMHDLVHDLALQISKDFCLTVDSREVSGEIKAIHLSSICRGEGGVGLNVSKDSLANLRTLYTTGSFDAGLLTSAKHLRVLILDGFGISQLPSSVGKLKHLRYLDVSKTSIKRLPNSITQLYNLQTLRVNNLEDMPRDFHHLLHLRHFYMEDTRNNRRPGLLVGIGKLVSLRTLPFFVVGPNSECQISELGHLSNLKGRLNVYSLENVKHYNAAREAKLWQKENIHTLQLRWHPLGRRGRKESTDEEVLQGLQPHFNLRNLTIEGFLGLRFPPWLLENRLQSLMKITLLSCNGCTQIPTLGHLPNLRVASITEMHNVKHIGPEFYYQTSSNHQSSNSSAVTLFPALRELTLGGMPMLIQWSEPKQQSQTAFPRLETMKIKGCPKLLNLPEMTGLTSLRYLSIVRCDKLASLPEGMGRLASLKELEIMNGSSLAIIPDITGLKSLIKLHVSACEKLVTLPTGLERCDLLENVCVRQCLSLCPEGRGLSQLPHLKELSIGHFSRELDFFPWPSGAATPFASLASLTMYGWPRIKHLPEEIKGLAVLKHLSLREFGVASLPDWLCTLSSIQSMCFTLCASLAYLPSVEAMRRLKNLQRFEIIVCPLLEERCFEGERPEWHKISHIAKVRANYQTIQCLLD
ncbi:unnamed protein product [Cuscuta campestris]|uniref:NB-ARC domain-containing protein n=1 Tax=Cuscuta campestris TaxID=132261 RepID=A0A484LY96_9ASTE|nr:unnamed protein product [Cuscuta campestris]